MMCIDCGTSYLDAKEKTITINKKDSIFKTHATIPKPKLEGLTSVNNTIFLGFIIGIIVMGLGHVYTKQIRKGLIIWISSIALYALIFLISLSSSSLFIGTFNLSNLYYIFIVGLVALYVWQGYDVYSNVIKGNKAIANVTRQQT